MRPLLTARLVVPCSEETKGMCEHLANEAGVSFAEWAREALEAHASRQLLKREMDLRRASTTKVSASG